jgi:hypothetical protein
VDSVEPVAKLASKEESPETPSHVDAAAAIAPPSAECESSVMDEDEEMLGPGEAFQEEINDHLPFLTKQLLDALDWILERDKAERTTCWKTMSSELYQNLILLKGKVGLLVEEIKHNRTSTSASPQNNSPDIGVVVTSAELEPCQS